MGRAQRSRPTRLAAKLQQIKAGLGLTQQQMLERLQARDTTSSLLVSHISDFELNRRLPPLLLLLQYSKVAGVCLNVLADDELDLPKRIGKTSRPKNIVDSSQTTVLLYFG